MNNKTLKIPSDAYKSIVSDYAYARIVSDYAYARIMARHLKSKYWEGKEDALMMVLNCCWRLTSVEVQESEEYNQAFIDVERYITTNEKN
jgi:hypothetical protein